MLREEKTIHDPIDEFYLRELIARALLEGIKPPDGVRFLPPPPPYGTPREVNQPPRSLLRGMKRNS
ncbi:MAG: hypothetical protein V3S14_12110 [Anaerolineae bacterium]